MVHDDDTVAREVYIELEPVGSERQAVIEGEDRVLGPKGGAAAMGVYERARGLAQGAYCNMPYDLGTSLDTW